MFYRLRQYQFCDIEIDIRDNLGRPIPFQGGTVTATLYFRQRNMRRDKKPVTLSQWVQVEGGAFYEQGTTPYQEGGWSPLRALAG